MKKFLVIALAVTALSVAIVPVARAGLFSFLAAMDAADKAKEAGKKADRAREATERLEKNLAQCHLAVDFLKYAVDHSATGYEREVRARAKDVMRQIQ